jgi:hypothetical protein
VPSVSAASCDPQSFAEDHDAECRAHDRGDEVAERALDHVVGVDRVDEDAPVGRDQQGRGRQEKREPPVAQDRDDPTQVAGDREHDGDRDERPDDPLGQDLDGRRRLEQREEQREHAPEPVRAEPEQHALPAFGVVVGSRHAAKPRIAYES